MTTSEELSAAQERPEDIVALMTDPRSRDNTQHTVQVTRAVMQTSATANGVRRQLALGRLLIREPFTTKDGVRFGL